MEHPDATFLAWIADRLVSVYGESANVDFVLRLGRMAAISQRTHIQLGEAMAVIQRVYLKLAGCSLPEHCYLQEISNEMMQALEDRDLEEFARQTIDEEDD